MTGRTWYLLWLDVALLLAMVSLQEPRATSLAGHEWIGIGFTALVVVHLVLNWRWIATAARRLVAPARASPRARRNAALNALLYVTMTITVFSGLLISEVALPLVGHPPSDLRAWAQIHSALAVVALVLVGLHLGLNWDWIAAAVRKRAPRVTLARAPRPSTAGYMTRAVAGAGRHLAFIAIVTLVLCGATLLLVDGAATATSRRRKEQVWATARLARAPTDIGVQLLLVVGVAVVGRRMLRLKL